MQIRSLDLTAEEADFLCGAVITHKYEDYTHISPDPTESCVRLRSMSLDLQDRLKDLFGENVKREAPKPVKRKPPKMSRGRIR